MEVIGLIGFIIYDIEYKKWRQLGIVGKYNLDPILYSLANSLF